MNALSILIEFESSYSHRERAGVKQAGNTLKKGLIWTKISKNTAYRNLQRIASNCKASDDINKRKSILK